MDIKLKVKDVSIAVWGGMAPSESICTGNGGAPFLFLNAFT